MSTRCITVVQENGVDILAMYRQMDGYPDGHGKELADYLRGKQIINGISSRDAANRCFNGMGCLAASLVAHFKTGIGSFYIVPVSDRGSGSYTYIISSDGSRIKLRVESGGKKPLFDGYVDDFTPGACREDCE